MSTPTLCIAPQRVTKINYTRLKHASLRTAKILALKCRGCDMCCEWTIAILQCLVGKQGLCVLQTHNCSSSISSAVSSLMTAETKRLVTDKLFSAPSLWRHLIFFFSCHPTTQIQALLVELLFCNLQAILFSPTLPKVLLYELPADFKKLKHCFSSSKFRKVSIC